MLAPLAIIVIFSVALATFFWGLDGFIYSISALLIASAVFFIYAGGISGKIAPPSTPPPAGTGAPAPNTQSKNWLGTLAVVFLIIFLGYQASEYYEKNVSEKSETQEKNLPGQLKWELVGEFPVPLSGNTFNSRGPGAHGARMNTGEVYLCSLEQGYKYRFTLSGEYDIFGNHSWARLSWRGGQSGQGFRPPFRALNRGALALRIGSTEGLHPQTGNSFEYLVASGKEDIFAEININRELVVYYNPAKNTGQAGGKLRNSTLSVKIERMPL
ncbi:MAG: hypothetical protein PHX98_02060 [Candidatus Moranbacteria bacterium]|nr:hypothetical protein [Candidatus Moranbacteria bacterium]